MSRSPFKLLAIVQALGALAALPLEDWGTGASALGVVVTVASALAFMAAASGWAVIVRSPLAWAAPVALALAIMLPPSSSSLGLRLGGTLLFIASTARRAPLANIVVGAAVTIVALVAALTHAGESAALVIYNLGCAWFVACISVREQPPADLTKTAAAAHWIVLGETVRMWATMATLALGLLTLFVRGAAGLMIIAAVLANLGAMALVSIGAVDLFRRRGAGAWIGAALGLLSVAALASVGELVDRDGPWAVLRAVAHNGGIACVALGLGALLDASAPKRHRGEAKRAAVTYLVVLGLAAIDTSHLTSIFFPLHLMVTLAALIVLVVAVSALRRLGAELALAARDEEQRVTFHG